MNHFRKIGFIAVLILLSGFQLFAQSSDKGDGTFTNPVLWSDVPDPDVIRVGDDFYLMSTTMHLMPGVPVMHSKYLVNWEIDSYVFDKLTDTPSYDLKEGTVYGRGQWATSIRYHNGTYYVYFSPNDNPHRGYVYSTTNPAGKWKLVAHTPHFHDASLFFDDDGRAYIFYGTGQVRELKPDLTDVQPSGVDMKIFERDSSETGLLEGSRFVKHNGKYYLLMISCPKGRKRRQVCYRADKITGPYEKKVILEGDIAGFSAFNSDAALLSVIMKNGKKYLTMLKDSVSLNSSDKAVLGVKNEEKERVELNQSLHILFWAISNKTIIC